MPKKLNPVMVTQELKEKSMFLFTPREFTRVFDVSLYASQWFIASYVKRGLFTKLRNGFYALSDAPRNHYLIANKLYQPSYISFETALSYHKLIPETIYAVTSAAPKATSRFTADGVEYLYRKIKRDAFTGYVPTAHLGSTILIAEPEKALADYLYFVDLRLLELSYERLDPRKLNKRKFSSYVRLFDRPSLTVLAKTIL